MPGKRWHTVPRCVSDGWTRAGSTHGHPWIASKKMGGMPALLGMKFNRRYATGNMGMPAIRGLKPTAKLNCRYATDKFHPLGMQTGKILCSMGTPPIGIPKLLAKKQRCGRDARPPKRDPGLLTGGGPCRSAGLPPAGSEFPV